MALMRLQESMVINMSRYGQHPMEIDFMLQNWLITLII
jgi:hypothetical protein